MNLDEKAIEIKEKILEVTNHFNYSEYQINLLTIVYLAIYSLEPDIEDLFLMTLKNVYIYFTDLDLVSAYKLVIPNADADTINDLENASGAIYFPRSIKEGKLADIPFIMINENLVLEDLFDALIHELKHALNDVLITFHQADYLSYYYSGLRKVKLYFDSYGIIDEAFNSYIVYLYLLKIQKLKDVQFSNQGLNMILKHFNLGRNYSYAYNDYVRLLEPLFKSKYLFWLFENAALYKDFKSLDKALFDVFGGQLTSEQFFSALDFYNPKVLSWDIEEAFDAIDYSLIDEEHDLGRK